MSRRELLCPACGFPYGPTDWRTSHDVFSCLSCRNETLGGVVVAANDAPWRIPAWRPTIPARLRIAGSIWLRAVRVLAGRERRG